VIIQKSAQWRNKWGGFTGSARHHVGRGYFLIEKKIESSFKYMALLYYF